MDLRDIRVNKHMNQRHFALYIEHLLRKDLGYMVQEFRVLVELRIQEVQIIIGMLWIQYSNSKMDRFFFFFFSLLIIGEHDENGSPVYCS